MEKRIVFIIIVGLVIIKGFMMFITFESYTVSAATIYVGSGLGNHTNSIQDAIDNFANEGDTIYVHSGTYSENVWMDKTLTLIGEDKEAAKIDQKALAESLADIDGLRAQIQAFDEEKKRQSEGYEARLVEQKKEHASELEKLQEQITRLETKIERLEAEKSALNQKHNEEQKELKAQISSLDTKTGKLEAEKTTLTADLKMLREDHKQLVMAISKLVSSVPKEEMGKKMGEELYSYILKDSKVPDMVIEGVGKFIDFKKYLGEAVERGAREVTQRVEETLKTVPEDK